MSIFWKTILGTLITIIAIGAGRFTGNWSARQVIDSRDAARQPAVEAQLLRQTQSATHLYFEPQQGSQTRKPREWSRPQAR
jgi:hypothetical protein